MEKVKQQKLVKKYDYSEIKSKGKKVEGKDNTPSKLDALKTIAQK